MTCEEAKAARFSPKECLQAGFTWQEGKAAGFRSQFRDGDARYAPLHYIWQRGNYDWDGRYVG